MLNLIGFPAGINSFEIDRPRYNLTLMIELKPPFVSLAVAFT